MNTYVIPRKYRKQALFIIENYDKRRSMDFDEYLLYRWNGSQEGWLATNKKEYRALLWLMELREFNRYLELSE